MAATLLVPASAVAAITATARPAQADTPDYGSTVPNGYEPHFIDFTSTSMGAFVALNNNGKALVSDDTWGQVNPGQLGPNEIYDIATGQNTKLNPTPGSISAIYARLGDDGTLTNLSDWSNLRIAGESQNGAHTVETSQNSNCIAPPGTFLNGFFCIDYGPPIGLRSLSESLAETVNPRSYQIINDNGDVLLTDALLIGGSTFENFPSSVSGADYGPTGLNDKGMVVGGTNTGGVKGDAFVWTQASGEVDLNSVTPDLQDQFPGASLVSAYAVDNSGDILAQMNWLGSGGVYGIVLLTPGIRPEVTSVTPNRGPATGTPRPCGVCQTIKLTGHAFTNDMTVTWQFQNGTSAVVQPCRHDFGGGEVVFECGGSGNWNITVPDVTSNMNGQPLLVADLIVSDKWGTSVVEPSDEYTFVNKPTVTSVTPTSTSDLTGDGTTVTVGGNDFTGATQMTFALSTGQTLGVPISPSQVVSDSEIDGVVVPDVTTYANGSSSLTADVEVTTGSGTSDANPPDDLFTWGPPTVTAVTTADCNAAQQAQSPCLGPLSGDDEVTVTGTGFTPDSQVTFTLQDDENQYSAAVESISADGKRASVLTPDITSDPDAQDLEPGGTIPADVQVTTPAGTSAINEPGDVFSFAPLAVTSVNPSFGTYEGGTPITVHGFGFTNADEVDVNLSPCTNDSDSIALDSTEFTVVNDNTITLTTPDETNSFELDNPTACASTQLQTDIVVDANGDQSPTVAADQFVFGTFVVTDLSTRTGPTSGGTSVVITGHGFGDPGAADQVAFVPAGGGDPIPAQSATVVSDHEIDAVTPDVRDTMSTSGTPQLPSYAPTARILDTNVQVTDPSGDMSPITDAGKFSFPPTIVQLGDSIAAGEGTLYGYTYDPGTGKWSGAPGSVMTTAPWTGPYSHCHDSPSAYGNVVANALAANFINFGCTGATYLDGITTPEVGVTETVPHQPLTYRPSEFTDNQDYDTAAPDVVLATFGADDIQFADVITACIASSVRNKVQLGQLECIPANHGNTVDADFFAEIPNLRTYYAKLASDIESRGAAASPPKIPKIVFTDYMNPFPPSGTCPDTDPMTSEQIQYLSSLLGQLNQMIQTQVSAIAATDPNVSFVDISHALDGHTWCTSDPWDYGMTALFAGVSPGSIANGYVMSKAPFHPTPQGQHAIARLVEPAVQAALGISSTGASIDAATADGTGTGDGVTTSPGGQVSGTASGFTPDETVDATLHSDPVDVGSFTAGDDGTVSFTVTLPSDTPPGDHDLTLTGETSGATADLPVDVPTTPSPPAFDAASPPLATPAGSTYSYQFLAEGAPTPGYTLSPGSPAWLTIDPNSGTVLGAPPAGTNSFTYSVTASNGVGPDVTAGPFTVDVRPVVATVPGAPTIKSAVAGNGRATVSWTVPPSDGGFPLTAYVVTAYVGYNPVGSSIAGPGATTKTMTGLTNGTTYRFRVRAFNAIGGGAFTSASKPVTPVASTVPGAPVIGTAIAADGQATVSWTAPASDGGSPLSAYVVTAYVGYNPVGSSIAGPGATTKTMTGLTNGTTYRFRVRAFNAVGGGAFTSASNPVTPHT